MRFEELIPRVVRIAHDQLGKVCQDCGRGLDLVTISDQLKAIDLLGKYGPGTQRDLAQFLDFERAKSFVESLAGVISKEVLEEEVRLRIVEGFKDVIRIFFPRP